MAKFETKQIRNIALLGHSGSGKTSLAEAMLYLTKGTDRLGNTTDGNTVCDFDPEEIKRKITLSLSVANVFWKNVKINLLDTPGFLGFAGEVSEALRVADSALITVDAKSGVEVGTELAWEKAGKAGIPKAFFINKNDDSEANFDKVFNQLKDMFGVSVCPLIIPIHEGGKVTCFVNLLDKSAYTCDDKGNMTSTAVPSSAEGTVEDYRMILMEAIAGTDDNLMEKFFNEEEITKDEALKGLHDGIIDGAISPCICGSATKLWSVTALMDIIADSFPKPDARGNEKAEDGSDIAINPASEPALFIFKTQSDQYGKISYYKVMTGELKNDATLKNLSNNSAEKLSKISIITGKKQTPVDSLCCGDIGVVAKLDDTETGDTLGGSLKYKAIDFPKPCYTMAVVPQKKGDEDKIATSIRKMLEEDPTLRYENNAETKQQLLSGLGDMHLDVVASKIKARNGIQIGLEKPKIAYRETIKKSVQAEGKHKKQSGGAGQYGHVKITFSPGEAEGLTFTTSVVGGSVPKGYFPAVEKGLNLAMQKGVLAGYPVVNLAADLFDGSYHDVDSNEISFVLAAQLAYKDGMPKASPILLEPIGKLFVTIPDGQVGDVMGDLPKRRGRVLGMNPSATRKGYTTIEAEVPEGEMTEYVITLTAMTQGRGDFTFDFIRYEEVPALNAQKIIEDAKREQENQ